MPVLYQTLYSDLIEPGSRTHGAAPSKDCIEICGINQSQRFVYFSHSSPLSQTIFIS